MKTIKVRLRNSTWEKSIGLLGLKKVQPIFFKTRFGIHTLGMKISIDVLILNEDNKVVKIAQILKPNRLFFWPPKYDKVIELPAGTIKRLKLNQGDTIKLEIIR